MLSLCACRRSRCCVTTMRCAMRSIMWAVVVGWSLCAACVVVLSVLYVCRVFSILCVSRRVCGVVFVPL